MNDETDHQTEGLQASFASRFSLRHPAVRAAALNFAEYGYSQGLRFASNLILARLLVPEDFGLMLIINVVLHGLQMFSDLGTGPALIQHKQGDEPHFLRTAWTISVARGATLWLAACAMAWPLAWIYEDDRLAMVLPVAALSTFFDACCSTYVCVLERRLKLGLISIISLGSYTVSVGVMITGALYTSTVWPLVAGTLVYTSLSSALTHFLPGAVPMRFQLDRSVARQLFRFGKWLTLSSMLTFVAGQLDKIMLGKLLTITELGVYSIAFMLSQVTVSLMHELSSRILHPVYARAGESGSEVLRSQVRRFRISLLVLTLPPLMLLYAVAPELIGLLYDERYSDAGWMLQFLSLGAMITVVLLPAESVLIARGDSFHHMLLQAIGVVTMAGCVITGYRLGGTHGLLLGYALSGLLQYPFLAAFIRRHGVWLPGVDLAAAVVILSYITLVLQLRHQLF